MASSVAVLLLVLALPLDYEFVQAFYEQQRFPHVVIWTGFPAWGSSKVTSRHRCACRCTYKVPVIALWFQLKASRGVNF